MSNDQIRDVDDFLSEAIREAGKELQDEGKRVKSGKYKDEEEEREREEKLRREEEDRKKQEEEERRQEEELEKEKERLEKEKEEEEKARKAEEKKKKLEEEKKRIEEERKKLEEEKKKRKDEKRILQEEERLRKEKEKIEEEKRRVEEERRRIRERRRDEVLRAPRKFRMPEINIPNIPMNRNMVLTIVIALGVLGGIGFYATGEKPEPKVVFEDKEDNVFVYNILEGQLRESNEAPERIYSDGQYSYELKSSENKIARSDGKEVIVGENPVKLEIDGNKIYVFNKGNNDVSVLEDMKIMTTISFEEDIEDMTVVNGKIYRIVKDKNKVKVDGKEITVGDGPVKIEANRKDFVVYVANAGSDDITVIDTRNDEIIETINAGKNIEDIVVDKDGKYLYIMS